MFWRGWRWRGACGGGEGQGPCCCFLRVRGASPTAHACRTALARCAEPPSWSRKALPLPKDPDPAGSWGGGAAVRAENPGQTAPVRPGGGLGRPPISAESHPPLCAKRANNGDPFGRRGRRRRRRPLELPDRRGRGERPLFRYWCGGTRGPRPLLVPPSPAVPRLFFLKISQSPRAGRPRLRSDSGGWTGGASAARIGKGGRNPRLQGSLGSRTGPGTGLPPRSPPPRAPLAPFVLPPESAGNTSSRARGLQKRSRSQQPPNAANVKPNHADGRAGRARGAGDPQRHRFRPERPPRRPRPRRRARRGGGWPPPAAGACGGPGGTAGGGRRGRGAAGPAGAGRGRGAGVRRGGAGRPAHGGAPGRVLRPQRQGPAAHRQVPGTPRLPPPPLRHLDALAGADLRSPPDRPVPAPRRGRRCSTRSRPSATRRTR